MKLLLIGGKGMLGADLVSACRRAGVESVVLDLPKVDICKPESLEVGLPAGDVVLNCAAFTRVDDAEKERDICRAINATGAGNVARACAKRGLRLIHISTDYVFDGRKGRAYTESDAVAPLNWYGQTKLEGEREVAAAGGHWTIVRTQSLYGLNGRNFVKAILSQIQKGNKDLRVVNDQVSSPTYTRDLADALINLARVPSNGLVNIACTGGCSWFDFAKAIVQQVGASGVSVHPRRTTELNYPALRPSFSVLDTTRFTQLTGRPMPTWQEGLAAYLKEEPLAAAMRQG